MTVGEVRQQLIEEGLNPDDYSIFINGNGVSMWKKDFAPNWIKAAEQQSEYKSVEIAELREVIDTMLNGGDA